MNKLKEYVDGYAQWSIDNKNVTKDYDTFAANLKEDGFEATQKVYNYYLSKIKESRKLTEAIFMSDDSDPTTFDDIYGEQGIALDGDEPTPETTAATVENLGPAEIQRLRDLAHQILAIVGEGTSEDMTGTPDFIENPETTTDDE